MVASSRQSDVVERGLFRGESAADSGSVAFTAAINPCASGRANPSIMNSYSADFEREAFVRSAIVRIPDSSILDETDAHWNKICR